jgi:O-6-methylguanine DNA methyltransferase
MATATQAKRIYYGAFSHPLGSLRVAVSDTGVVHVGLPSESDEKFWTWLRYAFRDAEFTESVNKTNRVFSQLKEYFDGTRREFTLALDMQGSEFQKKIWKAMAKIPYGKTISYGELAEWAGLTKSASRAVGAAAGANSIAIIIPCHRVIGSNGSLTGFGGGLPMKNYLLELERGSQPLSF